MGERILKTDKNQREIGQYLDGNFPLIVNYDTLSDFVHDTVCCHWHPELEFAFIMQGSMNYEINGTSYTVKKGDGIFINTNVIHAAKQIGNEDCHYTTIQVEPFLLGEIIEGSIYNKYINPILSYTGLSVQTLSNEIEWQKKIIDYLVHLSMAYKDKPICYELDILSIMLSIWHLIYENTIKDQDYISLQSKEITRIKKALLFIQTSYKDEITLEDIAASCSLSKSELCRLFKNILHQSPIEYTISYRITQSLQLISSDIYSITEIAEKVGFNSASYFTESFRKLIGKTPSQYKKDIKSNY